MCAQHTQLYTHNTLFSSHSHCLTQHLAVLTLLSHPPPPDHHGPSEEASIARSLSVATGLNSMVTRPRVRTVFPHTAVSNATLLSFQEGELITLLIPDEKDGWMYGELEKTRQ